jgi:hypothetical protein
VLMARSYSRGSDEVYIEISRLFHSKISELGE